MDSTYYITTPIYYVNDEPHIGHAYTTILADVLARYARLFGRQTFFLTGTDEHGQKVRAEAQSRGLSPKDHADQTVIRFTNAWDGLRITYDDFIRTTEERHQRVVRHILQELWEKGDIYLDQYVGWYCVPDERFWTEKDLVDGKCPDCERPVEQLAESNYFFRMSRYQKWLVGYIKQNPSFIRPSYRRNEVLGFLKQPLGDLCISRPVSRMDWGIPLPFDPDYVTYVWFDALLNYVTAAGFLDDPDRFSRQWPEARHLIGKDILITHSVYWPTMLKAAGLPQPKSIFAHGWWILSGAKMSKSLGNVVRPLDAVQLYGVDPFRYYLMRDMTLGRDSDFSVDRLTEIYEKELANDLGNLLSRIVSMIEAYFQGSIPEPQEITVTDEALMKKTEELLHSAAQLIDDFSLSKVISAIMTHVTGINTYLEKTGPWRLVRSGELVRVGTILYTAAEALRVSSLLLYPVMPVKMEELWLQLGWTSSQEVGSGLDWGNLRPNLPISKGELLFPKSNE